MLLSEVEGEKDMFIQKNPLNDDLDFFNAYVKAFRETEKNKDKILVKSRAVELSEIILNNQPLLKKSCTS